MLGARRQHHLRGEIMYRLAAVACGVVLLLGAEWYFMESGGDSDFASDRVPKAADQFDGKRAMAYLKDVCKIGPRQSGTPNMKKQIKNYIYICNLCWKSTI